MNLNYKEHPCKGHKFYSGPYKLSESLTKFKWKGKTKSFVKVIKVPPWPWGREKFLKKQTKQKKKRALAINKSDKHVYVKMNFCLPK